MPIVEVKGVGQAQFPDDMSQEQIKDALQKKFTPDYNFDIPERYSFAKPSELSMQDKVKGYLFDVLTNNNIISNPYSANKVADNLSTILSFLPGTGTAFAGDEAGRALKEGDYLTTALNTVGEVPLVGDAAIFAGALAKNADLDKLSLAEKSGFRPRSYIDTGWFKGKDNLPRFELDDSAAKLSDPSTVSSFPTTLVSNDGDMSGRVTSLDQLLQHDELYENYPELRDVRVAMIDGDTDFTGAFYRGQNLIAIPRSKLEEDPEGALSTILHETQHAVQGIEGFAVGGNASEDFIQGVKDAVEKSASDKKSAYNDWIANNTDLINDYEQKSDLARFGLMYKDIQSLRNYANSDSPSGVKRHILNNFGWAYSEPIMKNDNLRKRAGELDREWYNLPKRHRKQERNEFLRNQAWEMSNIMEEAIPPDVMKSFKSDTRKTQSMINALDRDSAKARGLLAPKQELKTAMDEAEQLRKSTQYKGGFDVYESLAGEVEARAVQNRMNLTKEERLNRSPTMDETSSRTNELIPRHEQIVRLDLRKEVPEER